MIDRRAFITGAGSSLLAAPLAAEAQQSGKVYRIGFISMRSGPADNPQLEAFRQGLREMGISKGRTSFSRSDMRERTCLSFRAWPQSWFASTLM